MERVNGTMNEPPRPGTCSEILEGHRAYLESRDLYAEIRQITRDERGKPLIRLGLPKSFGEPITADGFLRFRRWCVKNPHQVKRIPPGALDL